MKKIVLTAVISFLLIAFNSGCGLQIFQDWQNSEGKAMVGGGAVAGADYVNGLLPSNQSQKYFSFLENNQEYHKSIRVSKNDSGDNELGVKFVKNGGILIPPGVTIQFTNKGYCMDPHLPAPIANEEYQLIPASKLIPEDLLGTYKKLLSKESNGDPNVKKNMQHLIWALRTAGSNDAYANNLTEQQKKILNSCSEYQGLFEEFHTRAKSNKEILKQLLGLADSYLNVTIGGVSYKASDLLDPNVGHQKINEHINQLISLGKKQPIERNGFNFGEIEDGIYADVRGAGILAYSAKISNHTTQPFIFYPSDYVGQVGSGVSNQNALLSFFANNSSTGKQRVTTGNIENFMAYSGGGSCPNPMVKVKFNWDSMRGNYSSLSKALDSFQKKVDEKGDAATDPCKEYIAVIVKDSNERYQMTTIEAATLSSTTVRGQKVNAMNVSFDGLPIVNYTIEALVHSHPLGDSRYSEADYKTIDNLNTLLRVVGQEARLYLYDAQNKHLMLPIR